MEKAFYFIGFITLFIASVYFGFRCVEWYSDFRKNKFKTPQAHFISDLYKLKIKWQDLGEAGYVGSIDNIIKFHGNIEQKTNPLPPIPITNDSLSTELQLKNQRKEEFIELATEFIG